MLNSIKQGKFRTLIGKQESNRDWFDLCPSRAILENSLLKCNSKYIGLVWEKGHSGALSILDQNKPEKLKQDPPMFIENEPVLDFDFMPFRENYVSTCSSEGLIRTWYIPEDLDEIKQKETNPCSILWGHQKKINLIQYNNTSEGILASSSYDSTIKIWDLLKGQQLYSINGPSDYSYTLEWNQKGSLLGTIWKDKQIRIIDPRNNKFVSEFQGHQGGKQQKLKWMGGQNLLSIGISPNYQRELRVYDQRQEGKILSEFKIDQSYGAIQAHYDEDLGILWLIGKGESQIKYLEWIQESGKFKSYMNDYRPQQISQGSCFVERGNLECKKNEVSKLFQLTSKNSIQTYSFCASRRIDIFQEDLYPNFPYEYGQNSEQWINGESVEVKRKPYEREDKNQNSLLVKKMVFFQMELPSVMRGQKENQYKYENYVNQAGQENQSQQEKQNQKGKQELNEQESKDNFQKNYVSLEEFENLKEEIELLKFEKAQIQEENDQLKIFKQNQSENSEIVQELNEKLTLAIENNIIVSQQYQKLQSEFENFQNQSQNQQAEEKFQQQIKEMQNQINNLTRKNEDSKKKYQEEIADLQKQISKFSKYQLNIQETSQELLSHLAVVQQAVNSKNDLYHRLEKNLLINLKLQSISEIIRQTFQQNEN